MSTSDTTTVWRWGMGAIIILGISVALYLGKSIFIPTVIAVLLAAMLWPVTNWLNQNGIPIPWPKFQRSSPKLSIRFWRLRFLWGVACMTVIAGLVVAVLLVITSFGLGFSKLVIDAGQEDKQKEVYVSFRSKLSQMVPLKAHDRYFHESPDESKVFLTVKEYVSPNSPTFQWMLRGSLVYGSTVLWTSILITFILLFLLMEGKMHSRRVVKIFGPSSDTHAKVVKTLGDVAMQLRAYLFWRTIINFSMAALLGVVYDLAGLRFAWSWALLSALLWYIPYLGPIVAGFPPIIDAFVSTDTAWIAFFVLAFYVTYVVIEGYVVVPVVMGRSMEMNATTVMLACLYWDLVWGATGLFLAMPLMAAIKSVCAHVPQWRPWADLMSSRSEEEEGEAGASGSGDDAPSQLAV